MKPSKAIAKYKQLDPAMKAGMWFTLCNILQRGIQFIVTPIYTRLLSAEGYGVYSLFLTWINMISIFATLSLANGVFNNGMLKYEKDRDGYTASMQGLSLVSVLVTFIGFMSCYRFIKNGVGLSVEDCILMFVVIYFQMAIQLWSARQRYEFKYRALVIITVILSCAVPIVGLILFKVYEQSEKSLIIGFSVSNIVIGLVLCCINIVKGKKFIHPGYWKFAFCFNIVLIPHYLSNILLGQSDRIMINAYCGPSQAGIYTLAYQVSLIMSIVTSGIINALSPWTYQKLKEKEYRTIGDIANKLVFAIVGFSTMTLLVAPEIIKILGTKEYYQAVWIIPPVVFAAVIIFVYGLFLNILFYFECTKGVLIGTTVGAVVNIVLNALLIPKFGFLVAGYTTAIGYLVIFIIDYIFMRKVCNKNGITTVYDMKKISLILVIFGAICMVSLVLYEFSIVRYIIIVIMLISLIIKRKAVIKFIKTVMKTKKGE